MTESFTKTDNKQKSVVLWSILKGVWAVGFATKENEGIIKNKIKEDLVKFLFLQHQILQVAFY